MKGLIFAAFIFCHVVPAYAQTTANKWADAASWGAVAANVAIDTKASFDCPDRVHCFVMQGVRNGVVWGTTYVAKKLAHESRPCAPDKCGIDDPNSSFWSGHTAFSFAAVGDKHLALQLTLGGVTAGGRIGALKHHWWDTVVGAAVGGAASKWLR